MTVERMMALERKLDEALDNEDLELVASVAEEAAQLDKTLTENERAEVRAAYPPGCFDRKIAIIAEKQRPGRPSPFKTTRLQ